MGYMTKPVEAMRPAPVSHRPSLRRTVRRGRGPLAVAAGVLAGWATCAAAAVLL